MGGAKESMGWKTVAPVVTLLSGVFALAFGMLSWYLQASNDILRQTLEQRRQLAEDRERANAERASELVSSLCEALEDLNGELDAAQEREREFQDRLDGIQKDLRLSDGERRRLDALVAQSKKAESDAAGKAATLKRDLLPRQAADPAEELRRIAERWPARKVRQP